MLSSHARPRLATYHPYSIMGLARDRSTLAVFIYGCRGFDGVDESDEVGEGVEAESQPLSGELGKTMFSGRAKCAD